MTTFKSSEDQKYKIRTVKQYDKKYSNIGQLNLYLTRMSTFIKRKIKKSDD